MHKSSTALRILGLLAFLVAGCTVDAPFDPGRALDSLLGDVSGLLSGLSGDINNLAGDPLDSNPFPVLVGGAADKLYYLTNLGDVRLRYRGPTNDTVFPGLLGPSNLFEYANGERRLARPFIAAGAFSSVVTDGVRIAYATAARLEQPVRVTINAGFLGSTNPADEIVFDSDADARHFLPGTLSIASERVVFGLFDPVNRQFAVRVVDLAQPERATEFSTHWPTRTALRGDLLMYAEWPGAQEARITLRNLATDETTVVTDSWTAGDPSDVALTANTVVYAARAGGEPAAIYQYDMRSGATDLLATGVEGRLAGASDDYFLIQDHYYASNDITGRISIVRYDRAGNHKELADFRAQGRAGQAQIAGDNAVWVNKDREIIIAPLSGGNRTTVKPF